MATRSTCRTWPSSQSEVTARTCSTAACWASVSRGMANGRDAVGRHARSRRGIAPRDQRRADDAGVVAELGLDHAERLGGGDHRASLELLADLTNVGLSQRLDQPA